MTDGINLPEPMVPADVDLRDFPFTPMFRSRLFGSSFHARTSDAGWRAGVTLWLKSWDQVPAGTLPDDDVDLCRLAELGRDLKFWRKIKAEALWGWMKCSDSRLHHHVVAEGVMEAWTGKLKRQWGTDCSRIKKANQRNETNIPVPSFEEWLSLRQNGNVPGDKAEMSPGTSPDCPEENGSNRKGERKGQGKGKGDSNQDTPFTPPRGGLTATGLPFDVPPDDWCTFASGLSLDVAATFAAFSDHYRSASGRAGKSPDWAASWRKWCRIAAERRGMDAAKPAQTVTAPSWGRRVKGYRDVRVWGETWGPRPGENGCQAPTDILRKYGYSRPDDDEIQVVCTAGSE